MTDLFLATPDPVAEHFYTLHTSVGGKGGCVDSSPIQVGWGVTVWEFL